MTSRKRRSTALVFLLVLCTLLVAGCFGFNSAGVRDIVVIKLAADGTEEWQRTIDSGYDDAGEGVVELTDGRLVIIGQKAAHSYSPGFPRRILLSASGTVIDDRADVSHRGQPRAVVANPDGGWTILEANGRLARFETSGDLRWDTNTTIENGSAADCSALTLLSDGSYLLGGTAHVSGGAREGARPPLPVPTFPPEPLPTYPNGTSIPIPEWTETGATEWVPDPQRAEYGMPAPVSADGRDARPVVTTLPTASRIGRNGTVPTADQTNPSMRTDPVVTEGFLAKVGPDGRQTWVRTYPETSTVQSVCPDTESGGLIVAGKNLTLNEKWDESGPFVLIRTDSDGRNHSVSTMGNATQNDWVRTDDLSDATGIRVLYSERIDEAAPSLSPTAAMTNGRTTDPVKQGYEPDTARRLLTVLDIVPSGMPVQRFSVRGSPPFAATRDGGLIMVAYRETGTTDSYYDHPVGIPQPERLFGIRFDSDGQRVWERTLSVRGLERVYAVAPTTDGGFVVLGETLRMVERDSVSEPRS
jgi:hypothetical protein